MVVGYKQESFYYLEEKFGVHLVINNEYATRNNNASLMLVREHLGNTYICSSDNYFEKNPFETYVWRSYYAAEYSQGPTKEWCLKALLSKTKIHTIRRPKTGVRKKILLKIRWF